MTLELLINYIKHPINVNNKEGGVLNSVEEFMDDMILVILTIQLNSCKNVITRLPQRLNLRKLRKRNPVLYRRNTGAKGAKAAWRMAALAKLGG